MGDDPSDAGGRGDGGDVVLTMPERIMESALADTPDAPTEDLRHLAHHARTARRSLDAAADILTRYRRAVPLRVVPENVELYCPEDWCTSCFRDDQHHVPVTLRRSDGSPYYAGLCKWCGDFRREHGQLPSLPILRARHQGKRITSRMIDAQKPVKPTRSKRAPKRKKR